MDFLKRLCIYMLSLLLCISIYKDMTEGTLRLMNNEKQDENITNENASIIKVKLQPGETVLSITEEINNFSNNQIDIPQILADFKHYNPNSNPNHLQVNKYYYFLQY